MGWAWCVAAISGVLAGDPPPTLAPSAAPQSLDGWGSVHQRRRPPPVELHDEEWNTPNAPVPFPPRRDIADEAPSPTIVKTRRPIQRLGMEDEAPFAAVHLAAPPEPDIPTLPPLRSTAQKKSAASDDDRLPPLPTMPRPKEGLPRFDATAPAAGKKSAPLDPDPDDEPVRKLSPPGNSLPPLPAAMGPTKKSAERPSKDPAPDPDLQTIPSDSQPKTAAGKSSPDPLKKTPESPPAKKTAEAEKPKPLDEPPAPALPAPAAAPPEPLPNPNVRAWPVTPQQLSGLWPDDDLRDWSGTFRALSVFRNQPSRPLAATPTRNYSTSDFAGDGAFGGELALERRFDGMNAFEVRGMFADRLGQNLAVNGAAALPATGPNAAGFQNLAGMNWGFTNRYWDAAFAWSQRYGGESCQPWRAKLLIGPRFLGISENMSMNAASASYFGRAENALFGADAGAALAFRPANSPLSFEVGGHLGAFGNILRADQTLASGAYSRADQNQTSRFASLAQLDATADLCLAEGCHLIFGYRLLSLRGVARAAEQPTFNTDPNAAFGVRGDGGLLVHAIVAGLRLHWGGSCDPDTRGGARQPYLVEPR